MAKLLKGLNIHLHTIIFVVTLLIIFYIIMFPYYLHFYFEKTLGRAALLFFIIAITYCSPLLGILTSAIFIGLYNNRTIEGAMGSMNIDTAAIQNIDVTNSPPALNNNKFNDFLGISSDEPKIKVVTDKKYAKSDDEPKTTESSTSGMQPTNVSNESNDSNASDKKTSPPLDKSSEPTNVSSEKSTPSTESFENYSNSYSNIGRDKMLTLESYMRKPKSSKEMFIPKFKYIKEPMANYNTSKYVSVFGTV